MSKYVSPAELAGRIVFRDVEVIDPRSAQSISHRDVLVDDGRIVAVFSAGEWAVPAAEIDGRGRYLTPGFNDMHTHALNTPKDVEGAYALMLVNGITGFRQMSGSRQLLELRAKGQLPSPPGAPRLLATCGDLLTPLNAGTAKDAELAVRTQVEAGADFIKAGATSATPFLAALAEASRLGIRLGGHLAPGLDPREAARSGVWSIEHLGPGVSLFAAASHLEEDVLALSPARKVPLLPKWRVPGMQRLLARLISRIAVNPATMTDETEAHAYVLAGGSFSRTRAEVLAMTFIRHMVWQCPTLIRLHTQQFADAPEHTADPRRAFMAHDEVRSWDRSERRFRRLPADTRAALSGHWRTQLELTRVFAQQGVPMVTGTDACTAAGVIPGFALHDEFDLLAEAGLDPATILKMTTTEPARMLGDADAFGRVEPGQPADLVLLDRNPLVDHTALHTIEGVMRDGRWWPRAALDEILSRIAASPGAR